MMKSKRYFEITDNVHIKGRWHLVDPTDQEGADVCDMLHQGKSVSIAVPVMLQHSDAAERGRSLDYTVITGGFAPVVSSRVVEIIVRLAPNDFQLVPALVEGFSEQYFIVNVLTMLNCVDENTSRQIEKYTELDRELFPDKIGSYFLVVGLTIDKSKIHEARMFWTWGWNALIVSEEIKDAFEAAHVTGAKFIEV